MKIKFQSPIGGTAPVQAEGTVNGFPFYFKSRGNAMRLYVASSPFSDPFDNDSWTYAEDYKPEDDFAASYAPKEDCEAFLDRAFEKWVEEKLN